MLNGARRATFVSMKRLWTHAHAFVVVAADAGAARPPAWYLNLCAAPGASVRTGAQDIAVHAREVHESERDAVWRQLTAANRYLAGVSRKAGRQLPVLVLSPAAHSGAPSHSAL